MNFSRHVSAARALRALVTATALTSAASLLSACGAKADDTAAPAPLEVGVIPVLVKTVSQWDEFSGRIEAIQSVELRPRVSGYIERVNFREGQEVRKGDVLFTIDARSYYADLERAQAELARARSVVAQARAEVERARKLSEAQAISAEIYEQRSSTAAIADAELHAAQAAVDTARLNLEWTQVRAPIDGRAGRAFFTAGNMVSAGDAASVLTTLVSQEQVYVYFDADEASFLRYAELTRKGERPNEFDGKLPVAVALTGDSGFPYHGTVNFLDNRIDRNTGTIRVRAVLDNRERVFTPGLYARVRVLGSDSFTAMLVDDKAVLTDQDRKYVFVVGQDGKVQRRDVQLGRIAEGKRIIAQGLADGDRVIVDGVQKAHPGMSVTARAMTGTASSTVAMQ